MVTTMSETLSAAAAAMGLPEAIVERSAAARAQETGMSIDEILAAWAGGKTVETPVPSAAEPEAPEPEAPAPEAPEEDTAGTAEETAAPPAPTAIIDVPSTPTLAPASVAVASGKPPTLIGSSDRPMTVVMASIGLFLAVFMIAVVGSSTAQDEPGARTSHVDYSAAGENGRDLYASLGCAACHTQMVRPIVSDVGLGPVTLSDMNQIPGSRRFGPDLSDVANRMSGAQIGAVVGGFGGHGTTSLSTGELDDLVTYLMETAGVTE